MFDKFKYWLSDDTLFIAVLLIFVAAGSFGLGRQSAVQSSQTNIAGMNEVVIEQDISPTLIGKSEAPDVKIEVVASKSGTKYHLSTCPGAKQIKEANLIQFATIELAEAAGYTPASNCKF